MDIYNRVMEIVIELTGSEELKENPDLDLIEEDIIDSLAFIELIDTLNEEFDIEIVPTQMPKDTWRSIKNISKVVEEIISPKE